MTDILEVKVDVKEHESCVVRINSSAWSDGRGLHVKRDVLYMKRMGSGYDLLQEDASMVGADETTGRIANLLTVPDGLYTVITINEHRDWETGHIEDYDFFLVPITKT